jgi:hypothetical protein
MDASPFAAILLDLIGRVPGAYAAALVDREGETVDYAGESDPYDVKVAAAYLRICLQQIEACGALGTPRAIVVRGSKKSFVARQLEEGYAFIVLLRRRAGFTASNRAFAVCARALAKEAGWRTSSEGPSWQPVVVAVDKRGRPRSVDGRPVDVLGSVMGLPPRERGFRVRTGDGNELTLIREACRCWYTDGAVARDQNATDA